MCRVAISHTVPPPAIGNDPNGNLKGRDDNRLRITRRLPRANAARHVVRDLARDTSQPARCGSKSLSPKGFFYERKSIKMAR